MTDKNRKNQIFEEIGENKFEFKFNEGYIGTRKLPPKFITDINEN